MNYYLGIDIGGTNPRVALLNQNLSLIDKFKIQNLSIILGLLTI